MTDPLAVVRQCLPSQVAGLTAYLEARNQPVLGIVGVIWTIANRASLGHRGSTWIEAALWPMQYSCWNANDPNAAIGIEIATAWIQGTPVPAFFDGIVLETAVWLSTLIQNGTVKDPTGEATHYYNPHVVVPPPAWTAAPARQTVVLGSHAFYTHVAF